MFFVLSKCTIRGLSFSCFLFFLPEFQVVMHVKYSRYKAIPKWKWKNWSHRLAQLSNWVVNINSYKYTLWCCEIQCDKNVHSKKQLNNSILHCHKNKYINYTKNIKVMQYKADRKYTVYGPRLYSSLNFFNSVTIY